MKRVLCLFECPTEHMIYVDIHLQIIHFALNVNTFHCNQSNFITLNLNVMDYNMMFHYRRWDDKLQNSI